jgi:hypothetical protein
MVEEVEELSSEDQPKSFAQLESLVSRKIKVHQVGTAQDGASCIPEQVRKLLTRGKLGSNKGSLVKPAIETLMARVGAA